MLLIFKRIGNRLISNVGTRIRILYLCSTNPIDATVNFLGWNCVSWRLLLLSVAWRQYCLWLNICSRYISTDLWINWLRFVQRFVIRFCREWWRNIGCSCMKKMKWNLALFVYYSILDISNEKGIRTWNVAQIFVDMWWIMIIRLWRMSETI